MTQQAFEAQVLALTQTLYRVSASLLPRMQDREDAVQTCILKAWQHRTRLRTEEGFKPWIIRILINECYTTLRRQRHTILTAAPDNGSAYIPPQYDHTLRDALAALPEKLRLTAVLHYIEDMPVAEVAHILRVPTGTVKSRLHAARHALKALLGEEV